MPTWQWQLQSPRPKQPRILMDSLPAFAAPWTKHEGPVAAPCDPIREMVDGGGGDFARIMRALDEIG